MQHAPTTGGCKGLRATTSNICQLFHLLISAFFRKRFFWGGSLFIKTIHIECEVGSIIWGMISIFSLMERSKQSSKDVHLENVRFAKETQAMHLRGEKSVFPSVCDMHFQRCLPTYFVDAKRHQQSATEKAYDVILLYAELYECKRCPRLMPKTTSFSRARRS